ncbi:putative cardiolipin-specific deacylase, mitochondrial [Corynascus novoguineensis]|uniref:Cardiolipin-specific deacylase, mitochondrial n=1 Tax=Corynascus novoguineensis TaxID=1126955 RepID=A0AAN7HJ64_9PEZI|nr:putative cardiolipin-specific deacylase, mitochondrial [Corynascus novoguineensis]
MRHDTLTLLGLTFLGASASPTFTPSCSDVAFDIPVVSNNVAFASPPDPNNTADIVEFMRAIWGGATPATNGTLTISDTFTIRGTYCRPRPGNGTARSPPKGLQILVHGITYNKTMWAGEGFPSYDWHAFAAARGYATLALDRLGHGANPQRPDPLAVVQPQLQIDLIHAIVAAARDPSDVLHSVLGDGDSPATAFSKIVVVGHSYGSYLGAALAAQHPADADALVLTGYSGYLDFTDVIEADWVSAGVWRPDRFGADLPKGYVTMSNPAQRAAAFFAGGYDADIPPVDFEGEDTLTVGEIGALGAILGDAVGYVGDVLVVTAVEDAFFCEPPLEKCEEHLRQTATSFPDAKSYDYFAPTNTGHDLTLHHSAADTAERIHDWLDEKL